MSIADKLTAVAENQQKVHDAGKQAQYDAFWDMFQQNGTRTEYQYAFAYTKWTDEMLCPKYPLQPTNATYMFAGCNALVMQDRPLNVDLSKATSVTWLFRGAQKIVHIGKCDFSSTTAANGVFGFCEKLNTIDEIVSHEDLVWSGSFSYCYTLESVTFSGVIGQNGLDMKECTKLSKASIESIINALSTTTSGLSITLSKAAVEKIYGWEEPLGDSVEWASLIAERPNWTINLV